MFTVDEYEDDLAPGRAPTDGRIHLAIPELLDELAALATSPPAGRPGFPFVLSAGERRSFTANTIFRDPTWRKRDAGGALRVSPADAARLGLADGGRARADDQARQRRGRWSRSPTSCSPATSRCPTAWASTTRTRTARVATGVAPNELTASEDRDWLAGTPWHKHVPARLEAVG